jgi:ribosomal protein L4
VAARLRAERDSAAAARANWGPRGPTLILCDPDELGVVKSVRNLPKVDVLPVGSAGVADVIGHASLVISQTALDSLEGRLGEVTRRSSEEATA